MTTAHVLTGFPASGKSSLARSLYPALRFNMDDARAMVGMTHEDWNRDTERIVFSGLLAAARVAVESGRDIVLDSCHLTPSWPRAYRKELGQLDVEFVVHDLTDVPIEECIARDAARENGVGEDVIRKLAVRHADARKAGWRLTDKWMNGTQYPKPLPYVPDESLPPAVIVDIDGTVALHGDERGHYEYDKVSGDRPNAPVIDLVSALAEDFTILFVSGREDRCRKDTSEWLGKFGLAIEMNYGILGPRPLFMRTTGDHRPDYVIKAELFDAYIRDRWNVRLVLDDRDQVIRMWRSMGLTVAQVADGAF